MFAVVYNARCLYHESQNMFKPKSLTLGVDKILISTNMGGDSCIALQVIRSCVLEINSILKHLVLKYLQYTIRARNLCVLHIVKICITKTCLYNFDPLNPTFVQ